MTTPTHGERRLAVLLFADLSGYTRLCRTLDPEDVAATVLPLLAEVRAAVTSAGGIVTGVAGDGFLAVFGVPVSSTDIADRAMRAALEMLRIVRARSLAHSSLPVPDIHIGVTAGEVLAYPSDDPSGLSFIGPAINLAARLSDVATAGSILVDDHLRQLLIDKSATTSARRVVLQGHEEGVRVWELTSPTPSLTTTANIPFVGRDELIQELDRASKGGRKKSRPRIVMVVGEAGIGKSSLVREWLQLSNARAPWVNCVDIGFGAQVDETMRQLRKTLGMSPASQSQRTSVVPEMRPARPEENGSARARDIARLVQSADTAGLVIVLDDFHAADEELRTVVETLRITQLSTPLVIMCIARRDDLPATAASDALVVPPLDDDDVARLITAAIGAAPPRAVVDALVTRAEGRPLTALQSSAYLIESGAIAVDEDQCLLLEPGLLKDMPDSMRLFVAGRLDRLPPTEKQMLQELSAVGTSVRGAVVDRLFGPDAELHITGLVARGFLIRTGTYLRFSHGVVHEVAYASLPRAVRAQLHRRIVEDDLLGDAASRARHARNWAASVGETSPADRHLAVNAALRFTREHAQSLYAGHVRNAYAEARTVRPLLDDHPTAAPNDAAGLFVLLAGCHHHAGRYDDALAEAARAVQLCREHRLDPATLVAALSAQGEALSQLRHYQSARQALDEALQVADEAGDPIGRGRALRLLAETYRHSDATQLLAMTEEAFEILAASGDQPGAGEAARTMAYWLSVSTAPKLQRWFDEAEARTPTDDVRGMLELARTRGFAAAARLDFATAREKARLCRDLGRELGVGELTMDGLVLGVECAAALGLLAESVALLDEMHRFASRRAEPRLRQMAAVVGLQPLQRAGSRDRAVDARAQALSLRDAFGPPETMMAATAIGVTARDRGDWAQAVEQLEVALGAGDASGFAILSLVLRQELILTSAIRGLTSSDGAEVAQLAESGGAPAVASATRAAMALVDDSVELDGPPATLQEAAVRADAQALRLERSGTDAHPAWCTAADAWARLGSTVFLARAQARSGDIKTAEQTLDVIGAADEGRAWALQR